MINSLKKTAACLMAAAAFFYMGLPESANTVLATENSIQKEGIVLMLDAGHGGSNLGGQVPGIDEKNITLLTAAAMKEELEKYEGITVYMTRYGDAELSLSKRAQLAADVGADFFISLHYNKSVSGRLYGAEVWIPSMGENYSKAYACGDLVLNELCDTYGLYRRGIKTKLNNKGTDYYGVINGATALGIPSMIIEHCHMENPEDIPFYSSPEKIRQLGILDATGVARYFGLKSKSLGVDYSAVGHAQVAPPAVPIPQDVTPPETAQIVSAVKKDGKISALLRGRDLQSSLLYYDYSLDGGLTWSALQKWRSPGMEYQVTIPAVGETLSVRIYNQYDLSAAAGTVTVS